MAPGRTGTIGIGGLLAAPLRSGGGELLGTVEDFLLDPGSGRVDFVLLRAREGSWLRLPWRELRPAPDARSLVLVPGGGAAKRLLLRGARSANARALH